MKNRLDLTKRSIGLPEKSSSKCYLGLQGELQNTMAKSAGATEYTDCISSEG